MSLTDHDFLSEAEGKKGKRFLRRLLDGLKLSHKIAFFFAILLAGFAVMQIAELHREKCFSDVLREREYLRFSGMIERALGLHDSAPWRWTLDNSYWDQMVDFIADRNPGFAYENIDESAVNFGIGAVFVYDACCDLVYSWNKNDAGFSLPGFDAAELREMFARRRTLRFYFPYEDGVLEVCGASVHPTSDPDRLTEPAGYLLSVRSWDEIFKNPGSGFSDTLSGVVIRSGDVPASENRLQVRISKPLSDWRGVEWGRADFYFPSLIESQMASQRSGRIGLLTGWIGFLLLCSAIAYRHFAQAVICLQRGLAAQDSVHFQPLYRRHDEFRAMADALAESFINSTALHQAEMMTRMGHWTYQHYSARLEWSEGMYTLFGEDARSSQPSASFLMALLPDDGADRSFLEEMLAKKEGTGVYYWDMPDGDRIWIEARWETELNPDGSAHRSFGTFLDITEKKNMQERLMRQARVDSLTGIANRFSFMQAAEEFYARAISKDASLAVLMMDLDHFKRINDTYGHDRGDQALRIVADECRATFRESDVFARLGGEEFAALLYGVTGEDALRVAERVRRRIEELRIDESESGLLFTVSIGIAFRAADDADFDALLVRADHAMYSAKQQGRNRVVLHED